MTFCVAAARRARRRSTRERRSSPLNDASACAGRRPRRDARSRCAPNDSDYAGGRPSTADGERGTPAFGLAKFGLGPARAASRSSSALTRESKRFARLLQRQAQRVLGGRARVRFQWFLRIPAAPTCSRGATGAERSVRREIRVRDQGGAPMSSRPRRGTLDGSAINEEER
jgi:hypothetical protein